MTEVVECTLVMLEVVGSIPDRVTPELYRIAQQLRVTRIIIIVDSVSIRPVAVAEWVEPGFRCGRSEVRKPVESNQ